MKFSARLNSFKAQKNLFWEPDKKVNTLDLITRLSKVQGLTHVELNYPEHFADSSVAEIQRHVEELKLKISGVALRYKVDFDDGEFTNPDRALSDKAVQLTEEAIQICRQLGGEVTTIWLPNDGFDYPFQLDYEAAWSREISTLQTIARRNPDMKISFEYKPYQPRAFSLVGDIGSTLLAIEEAQCDNLGVTLDFCHMLMKKENPAYSLALTAAHGRLYGFHLNDGYKDNDDGLMIGSVHLMQTLEFIYYAKKYNYDGLIYFDTFPVRENPVTECEKNIQMYTKLSSAIERIGMDHISDMIRHHDALRSQDLLLQLIGQEEIEYSAMKLCR